MASKKKRKRPAVKVSAQAREKANKRLKDRWRSKAAKAGRAGTPPDVLEKVFAPGAKLPTQNKRKDRALAEKERREAEVARRQASSTSPGKGKPVFGGKPRGTGGRMTRGGS